MRPRPRARADRRLRRERRAGDVLPRAMPRSTGDVLPQAMPRRTGDVPPQAMPRRGTSASRCPAPPRWHAQPAEAGGGSGRPVSRRTHPATEPSPGPSALARAAGRSRVAEADALLPGERIQAIEPSPGPSALARTAGRHRAAETDAPFSGERIRPQNRVPGPVQCRPCGRRVRRDMAKTSEILHTKLAVTMIQYREESVLHQEERTR